MDKIPLAGDIGAPGIDGLDGDIDLSGDIGVPEISWDDAAKEAGYCKKDKCTPAEIANFAQDKISLPGIGGDGISWNDAALEAGYCKKSKCSP